MAKSSDSFVLPSHDQSTGLVPQLPPSDQLPSLGNLPSMVASYERSLNREVAIGDKSARTAHLYMLAVRNFLDFVVLAGMPTNVEDINREHCETFIEHLTGINPETGKARYAPATAAKYTTSVKMFFAWLVEECEIKSSPFIKKNGKAIKTPTLPDPTTIVLSPDDIRSLLGTCEDGKDFASIRDYAMLRLFWATGIRRDEMATLRYDPTVKYDEKVTPHLVLNAIPGTNIGGFVHVLGKGSGKGKRPRTVPFDHETAAALDKYVRTRSKFIEAAKCNTRLRTPHQDTDSLWLSAKGAKPLSYNGLDDVLAKRAAQAGLGHVHIHMLRHAWADNAKRSGMAEADIMSLAGWRNRSSMDRYAKTTAVARGHEAYSKYNLGAL